MTSDDLNREVQDKILLSRLRTPSEKSRPQPDRATDVYFQEAPGEEFTFHARYPGLSPVEAVRYLARTWTGDIRIEQNHWGYDVWRIEPPPPASLDRPHRIATKWKARQDNESFPEPDDAIQLDDGEPRSDASDTD